MRASDFFPGMHADLRYAIQFSPPHSRAALSALGRLYHEIREIPLECRDPGIAETKLRWWEQEIDLMLDGHARHPVSQAFYPHCRDLSLTAKWFLDIVDSTRQDIRAPSFATFDNVTRYCRQRGGSLAVLAACLCGADSLVTLTAARDLGCGWQLAGIVTRHATDAQIGRVYFAVEDLRHHRVDQHANEGGQSNTALNALLADYASRARQLVENAFDATPDTEQRHLVTANILAALGLTRAHKLARRDFIAAAKPVELSPLSALLTAWSTARRTARSTT